MNYKLWSKISLVISVICVLVTFLLIKNQKEKEEEYEIALIHYEREMEMKNKMEGVCGGGASNVNYDALKDYYVKKYEEVYSRFDLEYRKWEYLRQNPEKIHPRDTNRYYMQSSYERMVTECAHEYNIDPDIIRLVYPSPYVDDKNEPSNEEVSRNEDRDSYKSDEIERPVEPQDNGFDKVSGVASILGLFFTFFFRYSDKKGEQKAKEGRLDKKIEPVDMALRDAEISGSKGDKRGEENVDKEEKNENTEVVEVGTN